MGSCTQTVVASQFKHEILVAALACIASASAAVIPAAYNGYAYPYSYGYTAAQPVAHIAAASPVTYAAQPVAYAAAPVAGAYAGVYDASVAYANLYPAAEPYVHEDIPAEPYVDAQIEAEPYVHEEIAAAPVVNYATATYAAAAPVAY